MGDRRGCNGEYKCELSEANKRLVPDHIDRRVESGSSSATVAVLPSRFPFHAPALRVTLPPSAQPGHDMRRDSPSVLAYDSKFGCLQNRGKLTAIEPLGHPLVRKAAGGKALYLSQ